MKRYTIIVTDHMEYRKVFYTSDNIDDTHEVYYDNVDEYKSRGLDMIIYIAF